MQYPQNLKELLDAERHKIDYIEQYSHTLTSYEALKFRIFKDILHLFEKYPTLYKIGVSHYYDSNFKGWKPYNVALAWDSVQEINKTKPQNSGCVGVYINNSMNAQRDHLIIPCATNKKTSWNAVYSEVRSTLNYMNDVDNEPFRIQLYKEQQDYAFSFHTYSDYGHFNFNLLNDLEKWLDVKEKLRYIDLDNKLASSQKEIFIRKI